MNQTITNNQDRINRFLEKIDTNPALQYILLIAIMLLAALLRFYKIGEWGFWIDEI